MPKNELPPQQLEILKILACRPQGVDVSHIIKSLTKPPHRRTVQRWLAAMVAGKYITVLGKGRGTLYKPTILPDTPNKVSVTSAKKLAEDYSRYIPISNEGREIISYVQQNRAARTPVGYDRDFLHSYIPNKTHYLEEDICTHLQTIGDTGKQSPAGTYGRTILGRLLIDLSWASSRLEGNTYSRIDTERLIELGQYAEGKDAQEAQMILNHKAAIELLIDEADDIGFNSHTFLSLHGLLSENLMPDPETSGRLRWRSVHIGGSVFLPLAVPQLIDEYFQTILQKAANINNPFEQAFFIMVHLPYLQPFEDVNKRVSRLAANIPLVKHNLCPLTFLDVPERAYIDALLGVYEINRYELLRDLFVWAYERSANEYIAVRKSMADPDPMRLRYRQDMQKLVSDIVKNQIHDFERVIKRYADKHLRQEDRHAFVEMVKMEIKHLHPGIIARYRIKPLDFAAWQDCS